MPKNTFYRLSFVHIHPWQWLVSHTNVEMLMKSIIHNMHGYITHYMSLRRSFAALIILKYMSLNQWLLDSTVPCYSPYHFLFGLKYVTLEVKQSDIMMCWDEHRSITLSRVLKHVRPFIIKSANSKRDYIHYRWCVIDIPKVSIR